MSNSIFPATGFPENPNLNYTYPILMDHNPDQLDFNDYLNLEDGWEEETSSSRIGSSSQTPTLPEKINADSVGYTGDEPRSVGQTGEARRCSNIRYKNGVKKQVKMDVGYRIAFRTKSEIEIMDDGFKWRKYGKKKVKNSPHPRNYYHCSNQGCHVKKRVERDCEDSSYVITTYDSVHNHESPCVVYYNQVPLTVPSGWTLQASHSSL